jgi:hypothetical protein
LQASHLLCNKICTAKLLGNVATTIKVAKLRLQYFLEIHLKFLASGITAFSFPCNASGNLSGNAKVATVGSCIC